MKKHRQSVLVFTHAVMYEKNSIHGPAHAVSLALQDECDVTLIEHPLAGSFPSQLSRKRRKQTVLSTQFSGPLRWLVEFFYNALLILRTRPDVIIAIDPINALATVILQSLGIVPKFIYYTVDFADVRSPNPVMNWVYHELDTLAVESANQCWAVSERILTYRRRNQNISESKLFFIPNSPQEIQKKSRVGHDDHSLVIVSNIHKGVGFEEIFSAFFRLAKKMPTLSLSVIGDGDEREKYELLVKKKHLQTRVSFLGRLSHDQVHAQLAKAGIGLALYTGSDPHRYYSDSMKARDYLALGLPVIISGDLGTAEDIEQAKAGLWIQLTVDDIMQAIHTILTSKKTYEEFSRHALKLAQDRSFPKMVQRAWSQL